MNADSLDASVSPPFGTWNKGIDAVFLEIGCQVRRVPPTYAVSEWLTHCPSVLLTAGEDGSIFLEQIEHEGIPRTESEITRVQRNRDCANEGKLFSSPLPFLLGAVI